jgi:hypothetical protein
MTKPTEKPIVIRHNRWKHRTKGYEVKVESVRNFHGKHGYYSTVTVTEKKTKAESQWPALAFVRDFEPIGRVSPRRSVWQRL